MTVRSTVVVATGMNAVATYADLIENERKRIAEAFRNMESLAEQLAKAANNAVAELESGPWSQN